MAFLDWTHVYSSSNAAPTSSGLDTGVNKIEAASSLLYSIPAAGTRPIGPRVLAGYTAGVPGNAGLIRTMFRGKAANFVHPFGAVFVELQSAILTSSSAYWFYFGEAGSPANGWRLAKGSLDDIANNTVTVLDQGNPGNPADGSIYAVGLQYQYSVPNLTMYLRGFVDINPIGSPNTYDFSTMIAVTTVSDISSPLIGGVTAGVAYTAASGQQPALSDKLGLFDVTQIYVP